MSACCNIRSCSPFKTVFNKLGDTYQAYCNTYKMHAMASHHGGTGKPLDRDANPNGKDTDDNYYHEDTGDFEPIGQENDTNLANLTWELDDMYHRVQAREGQPTEALHCIESLYRMPWTPKANHSPSPISATRTSQQCTETLYRHSMLCPKANKLHKLFITRYNYFHWKWCHTVRRLVTRCWNCSWSVSWE